MSSSSSLGTTAISWLVSFCIAGFLIFLLNLLTILTITTNEYLRRRSVYCVLNLAAADILYGISGAIYCICAFGIVHLHWKWDPQVNSLVGVVPVASFLASLFSLTAISLERFCAIIFPLRIRMIGFRAYFLVIASVWFLSILVSLLRNFTSSPAVLVLYWVTVSVSLIVMVFSYAAVFIKANTKNKEFDEGTSQSAMQRVQKREKHMAVTLFIVTVLFVATWLPYLTCLVIYRYTFFEIWKTFPKSIIYVHFIQFSNSFWNPLVYMFRMQNFRKALFRLMFGSCKRNRVL